MTWRTDMIEVLRGRVVEDCVQQQGWPLPEAVRVAEHFADAMWDQGTWDPPVCTVAIDETGALVGRIWTQTTADATQQVQPWRYRPDGSERPVWRVSIDVQAIIAEHLESHPTT